MLIASRAASASSSATALAVGGGSVALTASVSYDGQPAALYGAEELELVANAPGS